MIFFQIFPTLLLISSGILLLDCIIALRYYKQYRIISVLLLLVALTVWCGANGMELMNAGLDIAILWRKIKYIGLILTPSFWFFFSAQYSGRKQALKPRAAALITGIPFLSIIMMLTNESHNLFWASAASEIVGTIVYYKPIFGIWGIIHTFYSYLLLLGAVVLLWESLPRLPKSNRIQAFLFLGAGIIPWMMNIFFHLGLLHSIPFDLTPGSFFITGTLTAVAIIGFQFPALRIVPQEMIQEKMPEAVLVAGYNRVIADTNPAADEIFPDIESSPIGGFFPGLDEILRQTNPGTLEYRGDIEYAAKDGPVYFDYFIYTIMERDKTPSGFLIFLHDITQQRNALLRAESERKMREEHEKIMIQQSKLAAMGEMIGAIAHQWRQPLNAVGLILQDIEDAYHYGEIDAHYIEKNVNTAMQQIHFLSKTIDDFRNFFRPTKMQEVFDVSKMIAELLSLIAVQFKNNNIVVTAESHIGEGDRISIGKRIADNVFELRDSFDKPLNMIGFPNEIKQVLINILNNAKDAIIERRKKKKYRALQGEIHIKAARVNEIIRIEISDNGGGIPPEVIDRIFEPYFSTKEQGKGTGIGLYMSKMIIDKHLDGSLRAENTADGAKFTIELRR